MLYLIQKIESVLNFSCNILYTKQHLELETNTRASNCPYTHIFKDHEVELYKYVFPLKYSTLAVIGLIQPIGSILPISEMQCRWAAALFSGQTRLPRPAQMMADIQFKQNQIKRRLENFFYEMVCFFKNIFCCLLDFTTITIKSG